MVEDPGVDRHLMNGSPEGDLRQLELFEVPVVDRSKLPWQGRSPRALTRGFERFTLKAQAAKSTSDFVSDDQFNLWLPMKKAPWKYQGAPLLKGG